MATINGSAIGESISTNNNEDDVVNADDGSDTIIASTGGTGDTIHGDGVSGPGGFVDVLTYAAFTSNLYVTLATANSGTVSDGIKTDTFDGIEQVVLGSGQDSVLGSNEDDWVNGMAGNDQIAGQGGADTIFGGDGNDFIHGGDGNDAISGDAGNDMLYGGAGDDTYDGGTGTDTLNFLPHAAAVSVTMTAAGDGAVSSAIGSDTFTSMENIILSKLGDTFVGSEGDDSVNGSRGNDLLSGAGGNDTFVYASGDGSDTIDGGAGSADKVQIISGGFSLKSTDVAHWTNVEIIDASARGNVIIAGTTASDLIDLSAFQLIGIGRISASNGNDTVIGSVGSDTIQGGNGADHLSGNGGNDTFAYNSIYDSTRRSWDTISDFNSGDKIDLSAIDANSSLAGVQDFSFIGSAGFSRVAGQLRYDATAQAIQADTNGDGIADLQIGLSNGYVPLVSDFTL